VIVEAEKAFCLVEQGNRGPRHDDYRNHHTLSMLIKDLPRVVIKPSTYAAIGKLIINGTEHLEHA
jgi:hypothetical protein